MKKNYFLFDEAKVNQELLAYLDKKYLEYRDILFEYDVHDYETYERSQPKLYELYQKISEDLRNYSDDDVIYLYEYIHNRKHYYREGLSNRNKNYRENDNGAYFDENSKKQAIEAKETYAMYASKDALLEQCMDERLFEIARKKFRSDIAQALGSNPWIEREL